MSTLRFFGFFLLAAMSSSLVEARTPVQPPPDAIEGRNYLEQGNTAEERGDMKLAARLYIRAVRNENFEAAKRLGDIFWDGKGDVPKSRSEAARYYSIAEKHGIKVDSRK